MATGKKMGRPPGDTLYPNKEALKEAIVVWVSEGKTLSEFCRKEGSPSYPTVYRWIEQDADFAIQFAHARDSGHDVIAEQALRIADTLHMGEKRVTHSGDDGEDAMTITEEDMLGHRKLQIETRLKLLAKWNPKKYGDKTILAGDDAAPIAVEVSFDIFGELLKNMTLKRQAGE